MDLTNKKFGSWTVLSKDENKDLYWICQCDCGTIRSVRCNALTGGSSQSCGCRAGKRLAKDISNEVFGSLTAIRPTKNRKNGSVVWECQCKCGNITYESVHNLKNKKNPSCGCIPGRLKEDLTGKIFGKLTVLKYDTETSKKDPYHRGFWICQCECGTIKSVVTSNLLAGHTLSCGCLSSAGEYKIAKILKENNIPFEREKTFKDGAYLDSQRLFRFDFYLPEKNIVIEFDGKQHFKETSSNWNLDLAEIQKRDNIKNDWCHNHNLLLIRIPYTYLDYICLEDLLEHSKFFV